MCARARVHVRRARGSDMLVPVPFSLLLVPSLRSPAQRVHTYKHTHTNSERQNSRLRCIVCVRPPRHSPQETSAFSDYLVEPHRTTTLTVSFASGMPMVSIPSSGMPSMVGALGLLAASWSAKVAPSIRDGSRTALFGTNKRGLQSVERDSSLTRSLRAR